MDHTFLELIVAKTPQETKDNIPAFWKQLFSNDGVKGEGGEWAKEPTYLLIDAAITEDGPSFIESIIASIPIAITVNPKNIIRVKRQDNTVRIKRKSNAIRVK